MIKMNWNFEIEHLWKKCTDTWSLKSALEGLTCGWVFSKGIRLAPNDESARSVWISRLRARSEAREFQIVENESLNRRVKGNKKIYKERTREADGSTLTCWTVRWTLRTLEIVSPLAMRHKVEEESVAPR